MEFFDRIKRERLARRGLSSGKKRRTQDDSHFTELLESTVWVRIALYALLAGATCWLAATSNGGVIAESGSTGCFTTLLVIVAAILVFQFNYSSIINRSSRTLLVIGGLLGHMVILRLMLSLASPYGFLLLPVALVPMFHSVLLGQRVGTFSTIFAAILGAFLMPADQAFPFLGYSLVASYTGVLVTRKVKKRGRLLSAGLWVGIVSMIMAVLLGHANLWDIWGGSEACQQCLATLGVAFGVGLFAGMAVNALLPILEGLFLLTTEISWLEMSDLNHPLLKRMQIEAPGTFHHSLMVAQLAEAAAEAIGANSAMCRVSAYFHDIGKLSKPEYFIENQSERNPHDGLTPTMSALIIVAHVKDGVDMAIKEKLAPEIIDIIQEHHGDSLVYYFYRKAQEQARAAEEKAEEGRAIEDEDEVKIDEKNFRYPGPIPQTRESAILSLADAVESASRTLEKPNPTKITAFIDELVTKRIVSGQLDDCDLTMNDLQTIRKVFSKTVRSMLHSRIAYPGEKKKAKKKNGTEVANVVSVEEVAKERVARTRQSNS